MTSSVLTALVDHARAAGWTDREWAAKSGVRPETLCRVKRRGQCDTATLEALTAACGFKLTAQPARTASRDGLFPEHFTRDDEEALLQLALAGDVDPGYWRQLGPGFFMGGFAFFLACTDEGDRAVYTALAEQLHPGITTHDAFRRWLRESPVKASRFLPMLGHLKRARAKGLVYA